MHRTSIHWGQGLIFLLPGFILNSCAAKSGNEKQANVIIILADDLGCGDMSLYGGWIQTPRLDQMAREGVWFRDFHSNGSVCSPTRAALMTGRYQQRVGIAEVIASHLETPGLDLLPTIMDITGISIPKQRKLDGISLEDHLLKQSDIPERQVFFGYEPKLGTAMRDGHWKMLTRGDVVELYDLSKDIRETTNIADKYPERTEKMKAAIEMWKLEVTHITPSRR